MENTAETKKHGYKTKSLLNKIIDNIRSDPN